MDLLDLTYRARSSVSLGASVGLALLVPLASACARGALTDIDEDPVTERDAGEVDAGEPPADSGTGDGDPGDPDAGSTDDAGTHPEEDAGPGGVFPFADAVFASTHNSYAGGTRGSIVAQLDGGVRCIELDVHLDDFATQGFRVGHDSPGHATLLGQGNPDSASLTAWLTTIASWSSGHPRHAPITLTLDLKDDLGSSGGHDNGDLGALNDALREAFGATLVEAAGASTPPSELPAGRVVAVLSGHEGSRLDYLRDRGKNPSVSVDAAGRVIVAHTSSGGGDLWYWTGQLDGLGGVRFHRHARYDAGKNPDVALSDSGLIVEVHEGANDTRLFHRVGQLDADFDITWLDAGGVQFPNGDNGVNPTVRFSAAGDTQVREVHQSQNTGAVWYWDGAIDPSTRRITWTRSDGGQTSEALPDKTVQEAAGKTLSVSTGATGPHGADTLLYRVQPGEPQRIRHAQVLFVEAQHGGSAALAADGLSFFAADATNSGARTWLEDRRREGAMTRLWELNAQGQLPSMPVSYPATDVPNDAWYQTYCQGIPCLE